MNKKQLYSLFVCSLVPWVLGNGLLPLLPIYASHLGATPALVGYYLSISYFALAVGTLVAGWLSDKFQHRKAPLIISSTLNIPIIWLMGQVNAPWQLTILTALVWFIGGFGLTLVMILAGLFADKNERGRVFGILALTGALGALIGGLTIGSIADRWGYPVLFTALGLFSSLLPLTGILLDDKPMVSQSPSSSGEEKVAPLGIGFYVLLLANVIVGIVIFLGRLGTSLAMHQLNYLSAAVTSTAAIGGLVALPLSPLIGRLSDRVNRKILLSFCFCMGACGMAMLSVSIMIWHFWIAASLLSIQSYVGYGVGSALITDLVSRESLGKGLSIYSSTNWVGGIIGFGISGVMIQTFGMKSVFVASAIIAFLATISLVFVRREQAINSDKM